MTTETPRQRVLVLGGAGSIGRAIALAAAVNGASVWIADIRDAGPAVSDLPGDGHHAVRFAIGEGFEQHAVD